MVAQVSYQYLTDASEIYAESFAIIRREADLTRFPDDVAKVVVRMIHAAAQTDLPTDIAFTPRGRGGLPGGLVGGRTDPLRFDDGRDRHHSFAAAGRQ